MGIYQRYVLPRLVNFGCGLEPVLKQRAEVVPLAEGQVLEVGFGSGLNLPFYRTDRICGVWALEPSNEIRALAKQRVEAVPFDVEHIEAGAEKIPLDESSADTVLLTYTLCTIPEALLALAEMRRVLKPTGRLVFCEHGAAPDQTVRRWQDRLNPAWKRIGGGCNLNRPIATLIEQAGFTIHEMETAYISGWKPASFNYWGTAGC